MFARSSRRVFVCSRCQSRLVRPDPISSKLDIIFGTPFLRRWQSTAVAALEDESNQDYPQESLATESPPRRPRRQKKAPIWRPSTVEQLGVPSLGKPAEVLVLPSRDRIIPIVPADNKDSQHKLQESLDSELRPVSPEQVKENIEQIRAQFAQDRGQLSPEQWNSVRHGLSKGFTQNQLTHYIEEMQKGTSKKFAFHSRSKYNWKGQMASYIVKHIWGFSGPILAEEGKESAPRTEMKIARDVLEVLLVQKSQPLKTISEKHNVQIDVFRDRGKLVISGNSASVREVRSLLKKSKAAVKKRFMYLDESAQDLLQWEPELLNKFLVTVGERNGVYIVNRPKGSTLEVYCHDDDSENFSAAQRDVLLATRERPPFRKYNIWPSIDVQARSLAPAYPANYSPWLASPMLWGRLIQPENFDVPSSTVSNLSTAQKATFGNCYKTIRENLRESPETKPRVGLREEFSAYFGQALLDCSDMSDTALSQPLKTFFNPQIPLLPQFLALRTSWKRKLSLSQSSDAQLHLRLILTPVQAKSKVPALEIFLTGNEFKLGVNQPLQIQNVSAIVDDRSHYLLLPDHNVDVHFSMQTKLDIYSVGVKRAAKYAQLLNRLAQYLNHAEGKEETSFPSFVKLKLPRELLTAPPSKHDGIDLPPITSATSKPPDTVAPGQNLSTIDFILETADIIDVASYNLPFTSHLCLDHIISDGGQWQWGAGGTKQGFRLAERPLCDPPSSSKNKTRFAAFFNSAYEIAAQLGNAKLMR